MTDQSNDPVLTPEEIKQKKLEDKKRKRRLYMQIYYERHKEKIKAYAREYQKTYISKNKERLKENARIWRQNNPERVKEHNKKHRLLNLEKFAEIQREHRKKAGDEHREYIRNYMREYRKKKKDIVARVRQAHEDRKKAILINPEEAIKALRKDGLLLRKLKCEQTNELCVAAVKQNPKALIHVKEQTAEVINAALKKNINSIQWVRDLPMESALFFCDMAVTKPQPRDYLLWLLNHSKWKDQLPQEVIQYLFSKLNQFIPGVH